MALELPSPLTADEARQLFPDSGPVVPENTFELGLVLGGTVSAGAYTAGVLDFLFEALDVWTKAKSEIPNEVPRHNLAIKAVTGASGGGVCAAIAARALQFAYSPVRRSTDQQQVAIKNPFYDTWVNQLSISAFLDPGDLAGKGTLPSLLNGLPIELATQRVIDFVGGALGTNGTPGCRDYVDPTLQVVFTLTNLRGVPYQIDFGIGSAESYVEHADHVRFAVDMRGNSTRNVRPDEFGISDWRDGPSFVGWPQFGTYARATAAFPVGFPAQTLRRPMSHYRYRVAVVPGANGQEVRALVPAWLNLLEPGADKLADEYEFVCVDGGATDNEPIEICRKLLAGMTARNPRRGDQATRGIMLVDPFADPPGIGNRANNDLPHMALNLLFAWKDQARYDTADLLLATDQSVYSRYLITAKRGSFFGGRAICGGGLGAFLGFMHPRFLRHDFLLGRLNCQQYLKEELLLPASNRLFDSWRADANLIARFGQNIGGVHFLPIIPLLSPCDVDEQVDPWPRGTFNPEFIRDKVNARVAAVVKKLEDGYAPDSFLAKLGLWLGTGAIDAMATDKVIAAITQTSRI